MKTFKINVVPALLAFAASALIAYCFYTYADQEQTRLVVAIGGFLMVFGTLFGTMGFYAEPRRALTLVRIVSFISFLILLISNIVFASCEFAVPVYVIVNGIFAIIYILAAYYLSRLDV